MHECVCVCVCVCVCAHARVRVLKGQSNSLMDSDKNL